MWNIKSNSDKVAISSFCCLWLLFFCFFFFASCLCTFSPLIIKEAEKLKDSYYFNWKLKASWKHLLFFLDLPRGQAKAIQFKEIDDDESFFFFVKSNDIPITGPARISKILQLPWKHMMLFYLYWISIWPGVNKPTASAALHLSRSH